jgi:hypothetical protein
VRSGELNFHCAEIQDERLRLLHEIVAQIGSRPRALASGLIQQNDCGLQADHSPNRNSRDGKETDRCAVLPDRPFNA